MRGRLLAGGFLAVFAVVTVASIPLSSVAGRLAEPARLTAREANGTVWNGQLREAALAGRPIGDVKTRLAVLPLPTGVARLSLDTGAARATVVSGRLRGVEDVTLSAPLSDVLPNARLGGTLRLDKAGAVFSGSTCKRAGGGVKAEVSAPGGGPAVTLAGELVCRGEAAVAVLRGGPAEAPVQAELRVRADGRYRLVSQVRASDPGLTIALGLAGYEEGPQGWTRTDEGRLIG